MRKRYEIKITFNYSNGESGGESTMTVNSKKAVKEQLEYARGWLKAHGHTETSAVVTEITKR